MHSKVKGNKAAAAASTATNSSCPQQRVVSEVQAANTAVAGRPAAEEGASVTQQTDATSVTLRNKTKGHQVKLKSKKTTI